jgi:hypothetical protein
MSPFPINEALDCTLLRKHILLWHERTQSEREKLYKKWRETLPYPGAERLEKILASQRDKKFQGSTRELDKIIEDVTRPSTKDILEALLATNIEGPQEFIIRELADGRHPLSTSEIDQVIDFCGAKLSPLGAQQLQAIQVLYEAYPHERTSDDYSLLIRALSPPASDDVFETLLENIFEAFVNKAGHADEIERLIYKCAAARTAFTTNIFIKLEKKALKISNEKFGAPVMIGGEVSVNLAQCQKIARAAEYRIKCRQELHKLNYCHVFKELSQPSSLGGPTHRSQLLVDIVEHGSSLLIRKEIDQARVMLERFEPFLSIPITSEFKKRLSALEEERFHEECEKNISAGIYRPVIYALKNKTAPIRTTSVAFITELTSKRIEALLARGQLSEADHAIDVFTSQLPQEWAIRFRKKLITEQQAEFREKCNRALDVGDYSIIFREFDTTTLITGGAGYEAELVKRVLLKRDIFLNNQQIDEVKRILDCFDTKNKKTVRSFAVFGALATRHIETHFACGKLSEADHAIGLFMALLPREWAIPFRNKIITAQRVEFREKCKHALDAGDYSLIFRTFCSETPPGGEGYEDELVQWVIQKRNIFLNEQQLNDVKHLLDSVDSKKKTTAPFVVFLGTLVSKHLEALFACGKLSEADHALGLFMLKLPQEWAIPFREKIITARQALIREKLTNSGPGIETDPVTWSILSKNAPVLASQPVDLLSSSRTLAAAICIYPEIEKHLEYEKFSDSSLLKIIHPYARFATKTHSELSGSTHFSILDPEDLILAATYLAATAKGSEICEKLFHGICKREQWSWENLSRTEKSDNREWSNFLVYGVQPRIAELAFGMIHAKLGLGEYLVDLNRKALKGLRQWTVRDVGDCFLGNANEVHEDYKDEHRRYDVKCNLFFRSKESHVGLRGLQIDIKAELASINDTWLPGIVFHASSTEYCAWSFVGILNPKTVPRRFWTGRVAPFFFTMPDTHRLQQKVPLTLADATKLSTFLRSTFTESSTGSYTSDACHPIIPLLGCADAIDTSYLTKPQSLLAQSVIKANASLKPKQLTPIPAERILWIALNHLVFDARSAGETEGTVALALKEACELLKSRWLPVVASKIDQTPLLERWICEVLEKLNKHWYDIKCPQCGGSGGKLKLEPQTSSAEMSIWGLLHCNCGFCSDNITLFTHCYKCGSYPLVIGLNSMCPECHGLLCHAEKNDIKCNACKRTCVRISKGMEV